MTDRSTPLEGDLRFPRSRRLHHRKEFETVFKEGRKVIRPSLVVYGRILSDNSVIPSRLGLTVSRKVGKAVVRNRVKRLLREAFRHSQPAMQSGWEFVIIARPVAAEKPLNVLKAELNEALERLGALKTSAPRQTP